MKQDTSWSSAADWYNEYYESGSAYYQRELILPNLFRQLAILKSDLVLDVACGQGFFSRAFHAAGARVIAVDSSKRLISLAKQKSASEIRYEVSPAHVLGFLPSGSINKVAIVLALQNIEDVSAVLRENHRVMKTRGTLHIVMTHPAFRVPKRSSWGWDETLNIQYRRLDGYLSESKVKMQIHPGTAPGLYTVSFHRPLQYYFKVLCKTGFSIVALEEWSSDKKSQPGPRSRGEDLARKEFPLFLYLKAVKF